MQINLPADLLAIVLEMSRTFDISPEEALEYALRDWAVSQGMLPPVADLDEDSPTKGNA